MPFLLAEILNFQGSTHRIGVGSFSKSINMSMSFEKRIENEINNDGFVNINAWHLVINVYLIKMKEEGLIEKEMYEQILCMINEIKNYCCFGYLSTPEEFLYDY